MNSDLWFRTEDLMKAVQEEEPGRYDEFAVKCMMTPLNFTLSATGDYAKAVKVAFEDLYGAKFLPNDFEVRHVKILKVQNVKMVKENGGITKILPFPEEGGKKIQEGTIEVLMPNHNTRVYRVLVEKEGYIDSLTKRLLRIAEEREALEAAAQQEADKASIFHMLKKLFKKSN